MSENKRSQAEIACESNADRISELEKTQITKVFYEQWVDKFNELKEQMKKDRKKAYQQATYHHHPDIKEVLRDSIDFSNLLLELFLDAEILDEENHQRAYEEIKKMIEKLDGKKFESEFDKDCKRWFKKESLDRHTEVGFDGFLGSNEARKEYLNKKDSEEKKEYQLNFRDIITDIIDMMGYTREDGEIKEIKEYLEDIDNNYVLIKEASGGEKLGDIKDMDLPNGKQYQPDSKPPEPKSMKYYVDRYDEYWKKMSQQPLIPVEFGNKTFKREPRYVRVEHDGDAKSEVKLHLEPRENDKKFECPICNTYVYWEYKTDHIAVKREDLQWVIGWLQNDDIKGINVDRWKKFKEEYNIK